MHLARLNIATNISHPLVVHFLSLCCLLKLSIVAPVRDEGIKHVASYSHGGRFVRQSSEWWMSRKHLMSVSDMVDAGHQVVFDEVSGIDVSRAVHKESGMPTKFFRRNASCEVDCYIRSKVKGYMAKRFDAETCRSRKTTTWAVLHVMTAKRIPHEPSADGAASHTVTHEPFRARVRLWDMPLLAGKTRNEDGSVELQF